MNLLFRLIKVLLGACGSRRLGLFDESRLRLRVWPTDLDINLHLTNSRYLSMMDLGRIDWLARSGYLPHIFRERWQPLVGACTIRFRRPISPFQALELRTRLVCWDDKWLYLEQRFFARGELAAVAFIKGLLRGAHGNVPTPELLASLGHAGAVSPDPPDAIVDWQHMEADLSQALAAKPPAA